MRLLESRGETVPSRVQEDPVACRQAGEEPVGSRCHHSTGISGTDPARMVGMSDDRVDWMRQNMLGLLRCTAFCCRPERPLISSKSGTSAHRLDFRAAPAIRCGVEPAGRGLRPRAGSTSRTGSASVAEWAEQLPPLSPEERTALAKIDSDKSLADNDRQGYNSSDVATGFLAACRRLGRGRHNLCDWVGPSPGVCDSMPDNCGGQE